MKEKKGESSSLKTEGICDPVPLKIAYLGGGSRGWAHALMKDLAKCSYFSGEVRLYDIDHPMAELNAAYGNWLQTHPDAISEWHYRAVPTLKETLTDADFIFLSIQPGSIEKMKIDIEEPMKYGIYQPVGDTVGPGGCIRALRSIRDYREFGEAIAEYAPRTWCINFSNPMTICTRALYEAFPQVKAFGCCHEVFGTQSMLGRIYGKSTGQPIPRREEVQVNVLGINHFTWVNRAECHGVDLIGMLDEYIQKSGVIRKYKKEQVIDGNNWFTNNHQVAFELFRRFGVLAAAGDRHLAEFVPWFLTDKESCYRWGFRLTPYSHRIRRYRNIPKKIQREMARNQQPELDSSGEEYINQMLALVGKGSFRTNVNLPNTGQMQGIPAGAVVETNALFSRNAVEAVVSGALPDNVNQLVLRHVVNQESLIKAVFNNDEDLAFQAFASDPLCCRLGMDDAHKLFKRMLRKTAFEFSG